MLEKGADIGHGNESFEERLGHEHSGRIAFSNTIIWRILANENFTKKPNNHTHSLSSTLINS